jgi:GDP-mannose transporter
MSVIDYIFLGREMPSARSFLCLSGISSSTLIFVYLDRSLDANNLVWIAAWYTSVILDAALMKHAFNRLKLNTWSRMLYCNAIGIVPTGAMMIKDFSMGHQQLFAAGAMDTAMAVGLSCLMGLALTFSAFEARSALSGTRFVVLGNICKLLSILVNWAIWNLHAGLPGLLAIGTGVICGAMYQEPKLKHT